ncbi:CLUMA_CG012469, isoform A [Clunio marinus]|uniref:CLUMA_CG012469, isoform A n=1 Tax=Clunio marinus TaxID=568069 RepID=A0A1J1IF87_9DIPT|nr:CLUMA_CG012469, isoform A [Clunio marinus]
MELITSSCDFAFFVWLSNFEPQGKLNSVMIKIYYLLNFNYENCPELLLKRIKLICLQTKTKQALKVAVARIN